MEEGRARIRMNTSEPFEARPQIVAQSVLPSSMSNAAIARTLTARIAPAATEGKTEPGALDPQVMTAIESSGPGHLLPTRSHMDMEQALNTPLPDVEIHDDDRSHSLASVLHADAFTVGRHVFFGQGKYEPHSTQGRQVLAHEMFHVMQNMRGEGPPQGKLDSPTTTAEVVANAAAQRILGNSAGMSEVGPPAEDLTPYSLPKRGLVHALGGASRPRGGVRRVFSQEAPVRDIPTIRMWRVLVSGKVDVVADGATSTHALKENMEVASGRRGAEIFVSLTTNAEELSKLWRWGEFRWRQSPFLPFHYEAIWKGSVIDGSTVLTFTTSTSSEQTLWDQTLCEARASSDGDTALLNLTVYKYDSPLHLTIRIRLAPPSQKSFLGPKWVARSLTIDNFRKDDAEISAENFHKIQEFWYSLTPETRVAIQNGELLNNSKVRVFGHTSNTGSELHNFRLGYARALAAVSILKMLSGNTQATNIAPMPPGERETYTDNPNMEREDAAQRKVVIELWEEQNLLSAGLRKLQEVLGKSEEQ